MAMSFGFAELTPNGQHFNTSIHVDKDSNIVGKYRKVHLPGHSEFDPERAFQHLEKRYFLPGDLGFPVYRTLDGIFGLCICNDRRWPETYRVMGLQGVEMITLGYNTPSTNSQKGIEGIEKAFEKDLKGIVENSKKGHDYAARVFVVKKTGATPLSNRAMNYVFSSNNDINTYHPSPFTKKSIDYILSTTNENFNEWVTVKVNVKEHFKKFHDLDLEEINGVAIMSDTDNSKLNSVAYYQNIYFSSN